MAVAFVALLGQVPLSSLEDVAVLLATWDLFCGAMVSGLPVMRRRRAVGAFGQKAWFGACDKCFGARNTGKKS